MTRGYWGIGIYHPKHETNVGTLWRSAKTYGASLLATVGRRYDRQASDTCNAPAHVPLHHYASVKDLVDHLPHGCPLIGVELDTRAISLDTYTHPTRGLYLLGSEDHGLPIAVLNHCHEIIRIDTPAPWSLNVATAGTLIMHDRYRKTTK